MSVEVRVEVPETGEASPASADPQLVQQSLSRLAEGKVEWVLLEHDPQAGLLFAGEGLRAAIFAATASVESAAGATDASDASSLVPDMPSTASTDEKSSLNAFSNWMNTNFGRRSCRVWMFTLENVCHLVRWSGPGLARATRSKLIQQAKEATKRCTALFQAFTLKEYSCSSYESLLLVYYPLTGTAAPPTPEIKIVEETQSEIDTTSLSPFQERLHQPETPKSTTETPRSRGFAKSLFVNLVGKESEEDACSYFKLKPDFVCALNRHIKANAQYFAVAWQAGGGSALRVVHLNGKELGRCPEHPRCARGLKQQANAFDLSVLNPRLLAAGADGAVALYSLPDASDTKLDIMPTSTLTVQGKVTVCMFSSHVDDLLCTSSFHPETGSVLQFWDTSNSECLISLNELHGNKAIDDAAFGRNSSLIATTGKDRFVCIINPFKTDEPVLHRFEPKENTRDIQVLWVDNDHLLTIGLSAGSVQSISLWQIEPQLKCIATHALAVSPQLPMPQFDSDSGVLIMCSPGSPKVQLFRVTTQEPFIQALSSYVAPSDFMAQSFLHKAAVNVREVEILHSLKLSRNKIIPVSWQVPRSRKEFFQDDLYIPTLPLLSIMSAQEWKSSKGEGGKELVRISLQPSDMTCLSDAPKIERTPNKQTKDDNSSPAWKEALRTRAKSVGISPPTLPTIKPSEKPSWLVKLKEDGSAGGGREGGSASPRALSFDGMVGITIKDPPHFQASLQSLTDELSNIHWLMIGYTGQAELNVVASGNTYEQGLVALQPHLPPNEIRYLLLRMLDVKENVFRIYFSQITGKKVTPIPKSKSVLHVVELKRFLSTSISIAGEFSGLETYEELFDEINKLKSVILISTEAGKKKSMRRPIQIQDETKFYESLRQLQSDQEPTDWLVFGYSEDDVSSSGVSSDNNNHGHHIMQLSGGQTGLTGIMEYLQEMKEAVKNAIRYIILKVLLDGGNGLNVKTIIITWVGEDVIPTRKAQSSFDRRDLMSWCSHFFSISAEFEASSLDEISSATIARKLLGVGRGNQSNIVEGEALASASAQVLSGKNMYGGMDSTCVLADLPELNKTLKQLSDHSSGVKWILLEYDPQDPNGLTVRLTDKGEGGVLQWRDRMTDTNVLFVLQRLAILEHGAATKTCMVSWVGIKADPMTKARSSGHQINIHDYFMKYITITARLRIDSDVHNFTDLDLINKINHGGGETSEDATADFQQFASKPITEQVEYQSFVPTAEQAGITFTGTPSESITAALHELKAGTRSMLKIYLRGKNMRELRIHGVDDKTVTSSEAQPPASPSVSSSSSPEQQQQQQQQSTESTTSETNETDKQQTEPEKLTSSSEAASADNAEGGNVSKQEKTEEAKGGEEGEGKQEEEPEVLSEKWRSKHLLPSIEHVCIFVLAIHTAEMGYGMSRKFVYIQWIGESVPKFPRSRALEAHAALVNMCSSVLQLSGLMQAVKPEEVTRETVLEKITGSKLRVATTLPDKLLTSSSLSEKNTLVYEDETKLLSTVDELVDVANPLTWLVLTYQEGGCEVLKLVATGKEEIAMDGFKPLMNADQSFFIVQQVKWTMDRDMRGLIATERVDRDKEGIHYGLVHWVGSEVGLMEKALGAYHWDNFSRLIAKHLTSKGLVIQGGHLHATELADLTFEEIRMAMRLYD